MRAAAPGATHRCGLTVVEDEEQRVLESWKISQLPCGHMAMAAVAQMILNTTDAYGS
jgi:hypothetical protein